MTTVLFVRHGPTRENREGRINGQQPGELLIPETERYVAAVMPLLAQRRPTWLISSDLARAVATRDMIKKFLQMSAIQVATTPLLRERAMGFYEGLRWDEVPALVQEQRQKQGYNFRLFGGESQEDVRERVRFALRELAQRYPNQCVCCVSHAAWLWELVSLAPQPSAVPDRWTQRTGIYEATLGNKGQLESLQLLPIVASVVIPED
jgi:broad specificity phosphatase PhoE